MTLIMKLRIWSSFWRGTVDQSPTERSKENTNPFTICKKEVGVPGTNCNRNVAQ